MDVDYELLYRQLLPLARVVAPNGVDGSDLVQEALTRALARHPDLRGIHDPAADLSTAVVNTARSWGARAARRAERDVASRYRSPRRSRALRRWQPGAFRPTSAPIRTTR